MFEGHGDFLFGVGVVELAEITSIPETRPIKNGENVAACLTYFPGLFPYPV